MEEQDVVFDFTVLGAGVEGSSTAYNLVASNSKAAKVLLLEQFQLLHNRGSSHGPSRITRRAYIQPHLAKMMDEAYQLWETIEGKSGVKLYQETGILVFGVRDNPLVDSVVNSMEVNDIPHEVMSGREANQRYPDQLKLPDDYKCVYEGSGGIILAAKALAAFQKLFVAEGGVIRDNHKVTEIQPGPVITLVTSKATFRTRHLVITAGGWSKDILSTLGLDLPLKVVRTEVYYWTPKDPDKFSYREFPCVIEYNVDSHFYGVPEYEYPGMFKSLYMTCAALYTAAHRKEQLWREQHRLRKWTGFKFCPFSGVDIPSPEQRDRGGVAQLKDQVSTCVQKYLKGVSSEPSIYEGCIFTMTPDEDPILDTHPSYPNIAIGAGFSGHGFKLSPVVGKLLSQLVQGIPPSFDMEPFKIKRFI